MPYCLLKNLLPWMSLFFLGLFLASSIFLGYGFSSMILTSILTLSNLIFNFSKHKQTPPPREEKSAALQSDHQESTNYSPSKQATVAEAETFENENNDQNKEDEQDGKSKIMLSESECQGRSSTSEEDSEADYWQGNIFGSQDNSDGSISDEDSLIEISLPSGVYIDHYNEEKKKKLGDDLFFKQQMSLVELLAELNEMNEEDNLIEIDISMGSIKCPRFEIQA